VAVSYVHKVCVCTSIMWSLRYLVVGSAGEDLGGVGVEDHALEDGLREHRTHTHQPARHQRRASKEGSSQTREAGGRPRALETGEDLEHVMR
jgi:hypothetical protein